MIQLVLSVVLAVQIGPGTEIKWDCGFYTHPEGIPGRQWVSVPKTLVVIGHMIPRESPDRKHAERFLVCVEKGDYPPYDGYFVIDRRKLRASDVAKFKGGLLIGNSASLDIKEEP